MLTKRKWTHLTSVSALSALLSYACGAHSGGGAGASQGGCPTYKESAGSKIHDDAFLKLHPDEIHTVAVTLKSPPAVGGSCGAGQDAASGCAQRDAALAQRAQLNQDAADCVVASLEKQSVAGGLVTLWYEAPALDSAGRPWPIGTAFRVGLSVPQIRGLAQHPLVAAIDAAPGLAAGMPGASSSAPAECPTRAEDPAPKLVDALSLKGQGRQQVIVEYRDDGFLPPPIVCDAAASCEPATNRLWERTILNTRQVTCVLRWIDAKLATPPARTSYGEIAGELLPLLPPFGESPSTTKGQGMMLSWDEAVQVAGHPYVERIRASPEVAAPSADPQCPPDLSAPILTPACPTQREPIDGKMEARTRAIFEQATGAVDVAISVVGGATVCQLNNCSSPSCPDPARIQERWRQENAAAQTCVKELVQAVGGTVTPGDDLGINVFLASLTWPQIQAVAAHPHVRRIDSNL